MTEKEYLDILFDQRLEVVEEVNEIPKIKHQTFLYVYGELAAVRTITANGVTYQRV